MDGFLRFGLTHPITSLHALGRSGLVELLEALSIVIGNPFGGFAFHKYPLHQERDRELLGVETLRFSKQAHRFGAKLVGCVFLAIPISVPI
ncbi:MAG: hypothetical protein JNK87_18155 [Bryobacterales bacterium]|nr:hypothetical protein [Bryobacterales bacterium]